MLEEPLARRFWVGIESLRKRAQNKYRAHVRGLVLLVGWRSFYRFRRRKKGVVKSMVTLPKPNLCNSFCGKTTISIQSNATAREPMGAYLITLCATLTLGQNLITITF